MGIWWEIDGIIEEEHKHNKLVIMAFLNKDMVERWS